LLVLCIDFVETVNDRRQDQIQREEGAENNKEDKEKNGEILDLGVHEVVHQVAPPF
jgi:hypothetical protein